MTYSELEAVEKSARMVEGNAVEIEQAPLGRKIGRLVIGICVLVLGGLALALVVLWRAQ